MRIEVIAEGQVPSTVGNQGRSTSAMDHDISSQAPQHAVVRTGRPETHPHRIQMPPCCDFPIGRESRAEAASVEDNDDGQRLEFVSKYIRSEIQGNVRLMQRAIDIRDSFRTTSSSYVRIIPDDGEISELLQNILTHLNRMLKQANKLHKRVSGATTLATALKAHRKGIDLLDQAMVITAGVNQSFHSRKAVSICPRHHDLMRDINVAFYKIKNASLLALYALAHYPEGMSCIQARADEDKIQVIGEDEVPLICAIQARRFKDQLQLSSLAPVTRDVRGIPGTSETSQTEWCSIWTFIEEGWKRLTCLSSREVRTFLQGDVENFSVYLAKLERRLETMLVRAEEEASRVLETLSVSDARQAYQRFTVYYDGIVDRYTAAVERFGGSTSLQTTYIATRRAYLRCVSHLVNRHFIEGDWDYIAGRARQFTELTQRLSLAPVTWDVGGIPGTSETSQTEWRSIWAFILEEWEHLKRLSSMEIRTSPQEDVENVSELLATLERYLTTILVRAEEEAGRVLETLSVGDARQAYQRFRVYYNEIIEKYNAAVDWFDGSTSLQSTYIAARRAYLRCVGHLMNRHCIEGNWDYIASEARQFNELNERRNRSL